MKDDTIMVLIPTACDVAYLSPSQIEAYGSPEQAKTALGVGYIALPEVLLGKGEVVGCIEVGHA